MIWTSPAFKFCSFLMSNRWRTSIVLTIESEKLMKFLNECEILVNKLKASWVQSTTNEFANQKEGYRMVNSRPCETARPQFRNSWNKIENPRLKITRNQTSRPIWNRHWRFQDRAFRDPHIWSSHSIRLKGFIVLDCLRQIAHNISFIDNFKHKITLEGHSETLLSTTERRAVSPIDW